MCVIAAKPKNSVIKKETLQRCFAGNSDGAGFVVSRNNRLIMRKGFFTFDAFWEAYQPYERDTAVIHFRIKTHGARDAEMCHPFEVLPDRLWMAHNGIIDIDTKNDPKKSDTWHFVDLVLKPELSRDPLALTRSSFQYLLGCTIGGSKLAFLNNRGQITIINKSKGEMDGDVWYSNGSYKTPRYTQTTAWNREDDRDVYYGYQPGNHTHAPTRPVTGSTPPAATTKPTVLYASLGAVPARDSWIVETLRDFEFDDDEILTALNADIAEDTALELLLCEARHKKAGNTLTREEIVEEIIGYDDDAEEDAAIAKAAEEGTGQLLIEEARAQEDEVVYTGEKA